MGRVLRGDTPGMMANYTIVGMLVQTLARRKAAPNPDGVNNMAPSTPPITSANNKQRTDHTVPSAHPTPCITAARNSYTRKVATRRQPLQRSTRTGGNTI